ncbi:uncharacterized protein [Aristolochia californica]|uniref:uncharacterized protein n=1 Tax=Aristolochia californica TaxID=171875 RepID=UPI0035D9808C
MGNFLSLGLITRGKKVFTDKLYEQYSTRLNNQENFEDTVIEIFTRINGSIPGTRFAPPGHQEMKEFHMQWQKESDPAKKKEVFAELITKVLSNVQEQKTSTIVMLAGVGAPPAALLAKRAGENIPGINKIRYIPDFVLVPTATLVALFGVKFLQSDLNKEI